MPKLQNVTYQGKFHQSRGNSWVQHFQTNCSFAIFAFSVLPVWVVIFRLWKICAATKWIFIILLLHLNTVFHWLLQTRTVSWLQMRTESLACFPCKMWNSFKKCCSTEQDVLSSAFPNILIFTCLYFTFILFCGKKQNDPPHRTSRDSPGCPWHTSASPKGVSSGEVDFLAVHSRAGFWWTSLWHYKVTHYCLGSYSGVFRDISH